MLKTTACFFTCIAMLGSALAEYRVWTDKKGKELEAEFVCMSMGRVVLKAHNGKEYKPELDSLSENDQKYLQRKIPPEIDIAFSKNQDRRTESAVTSMQGKVTLKKTSKMPYSGMLHAIFYMFGENDYLHEYVILDRTESEFDFSSNDTHLINGNFFRMHDIQSANYGIEYKGFLVIVLDEHSQVVALKSNRNQFVRQINDFVQLRVGDSFSSKLENRTASKYFYNWHPYCNRDPYYWDR